MKHLIAFLLFGVLLFSCTKDAEIAADGPAGQSGSVTRFAIQGNYMYVLNMNEVQTYDITNRDQPRLVHRLSTDYGLETIVIYEGTAFLGSTTSLYLLDITTHPEAPGIISTTNRVELLGFSHCDPVVVKGDYAYSTIKVIANVCGSIGAESALLIYDISDQSRPILVDQRQMNIPNGLGYKDNYLMVCDEGTDAVEVFDITDPHSLVDTEIFIPVTDPQDLIISGNRMIVSAPTSFYLFDIQDVQHVKQLAVISR